MNTTNTTGWLGLAVMVATTLGASTIALAEGDAERRAAAEALNAEGKTLIKDLDLDGAAAKFREAIGLVEDPRYAFNLCFTLEKSGGLDEAQLACKWVTGSTDKRLAKKAAVLLGKVEAKIAERPKVPVPVATPDPKPTPVPPPVRYPPPVGKPPPPVGNPGVPLPPPPLLVPPKPKSDRRIGVRAGFTNSFMVGPDSDEDSHFAGSFGLAYGRNMNSSLQIISEIQVAGRGAVFSLGPNFSGNEIDVSLVYLDTIGLMRYQFGSGRVQPFVDLGGAFSLLLSQDASSDGISDTLSESLNDFATVDMSIVSGFGAMMGSFELRLTVMYGLLDVSPSEGPGREFLNNRSTLFQAGFFF